MRSIRQAAALAALLFGCTTSQPPDPSQDPTLGSGAGFHDPLPPRGAVCVFGVPPGSVLSSVAITGGSQVAVDASGNLFYSGDAGIVKLNAYAFGFGSVFALDANGNAYVAGAFSDTIDLGQGFVLTAAGNVDTFVAKLDSRGAILAAFDIGSCGVGVESIAVARDGRIAVSGLSMGTFVVDATGELLFQLGFDGQLTFDSHGNLFIGGQFTGALDVDAFVAEVDASGNLLHRVQLGDSAGAAAPSTQAVVSLAMNASDELAVLGTFDGEMDLFGTPLQVPAELPSGHPLGSFDVVFDDTLAVRYSRQANTFYDYNPPGAIAIDAAGDVAISSNETSEEFFPQAHPTLVKLDASGAVEFAVDDDPIEGYGLGVAFDACGDVVWATSEHATLLNPLAPLLEVVAH